MDIRGLSPAELKSTEISKPARDTSYQVFVVQSFTFEEHFKTSTIMDIGIIGDFLGVLTILVS